MESSGPGAWSAYLANARLAVQSGSALEVRGTLTRLAGLVLEASGLVRSRKEGRVRTCLIQTGALQGAERWIASRRSHAKYTRYTATYTQLLRSFRPAKLNWQRLTVPVCVHIHKDIFSVVDRQT